ncbi:sulfite exporter TauE/SafE family protein [Rodentibacter myodis]|uniref:Probable membrane transporter protein n=1 Tax=Rodentibacter myodis TaxID=1907939 RepID=A0A1V3JQR4_9PAST|nr:sulfite exporter TauE/SafE family protein [Rodentibacter myodis]OOF58742.1 hypothetical protein BKL49_06225 [Rodentibacter myodis]
MSLQLIAILILCGIFTNLMSAVLGIGGGVLMVPILYSLFPDFPLQMVAATSLTIVIGSACINLFHFYKQHIAIDLKAVMGWSLAMIVGVQLGFESSFYLTDSVVIAVFVGTLSLLAVRTLLGTTKKQNGIKGQNDLFKGAGLCLFGGVIAGMTGIGGGSIMAPLIGRLNSVKPQQIAPYTNAMMIIGGLGSLYGYLAKTPNYYLAGSWQIGYVNFSVVMIVIGAVFITGFFSMKIRGRLAPELTQKLLGIILLVIASYMVGSYYLKN